MCRHVGRSGSQASLDVPRDVVDIVHTLDSFKDAPFPVVGENWGRLPVIGGETVMHRLLIVVGAARELGVPQASQTPSTLGFSNLS